MKLEAFIHSISEEQSLFPLCSFVFVISMVVLGDSRKPWKPYQGSPLYFLDINLPSLKKKKEHFQEKSEGGGGGERRGEAGEGANLPI